MNLPGDCGTENQLKRSFGASGKVGSLKSKRKEQKAMVYSQKYDSPLGEIVIACDEEAMIGLWFSGQRHFANVLPDETVCRETPLLLSAKRWLDAYFSGRQPDFLPPLRYDSTPFRKAVCERMLQIPYGQTISYGEIARQIAKDRGIAKMSAQAVGGAVGHNPISLMIPCHRVVGENGNLTGYGGGLERKIRLLRLEGADVDSFFFPKKGMVKK